MGCQDTVKPIPQPRLDDRTEPNGPDSRTKANSRRSAPQTEGTTGEDVRMADGRIQRTWGNFLPVAVSICCAAMALQATGVSAQEGRRGGGADAGSKRELRAGAATSNITPPIGEGIVGGFTTPSSTHVH